MQKGCATFLVMACSQYTCSGHCTTALLRIRFNAYVLPVDSSAHHDGGSNSSIDTLQLVVNQSASGSTGGTYPAGS